MSKDFIERLLASGSVKEIITAKQAKEFDRHTTTTLGVSSHLLMENAGKAVADYVLPLLQKASKKTLVAIFVGPGSNGADGVVAARHLLAQGIDVVLYFLTPAEKWNRDLAFHVDILRKIIDFHSKKSAHEILKQFNETTSLNELKAWSCGLIIIDALFGAGLSRPLSGIVSTMVQFINKYRQQHAKSCEVVSIDIPSGLSLDAETPHAPFIVADHTITFEYLKRAHISEPTKKYCGLSTSASIGLFADSPIKTYWVSQRKTLKELFVPLKDNCHKGNFGHVLVFEGSKPFRGASRLAAHAALRVGSGLVTIAGNETLVERAEFMHCPKDDVPKALLKSIDALVIGPGISDEQDQQQLALHFLNNLNDNIPRIVIDAGALSLLANSALNINNKSLILTPHPKEAARLLSCSTEQVENNRFWAINELAKCTIKNNNEMIWLLKGATTLVRGPTGAIFAFKGDTPVLAAGGSGDILSGTIAGLCKQTLSSVESALLAVSLQIEAANTLSHTITKGSFASELADLFPHLTKRSLHEN